MISPKELYTFIPFAVKLTRNIDDAKDLIHDVYIKLASCAYEERGHFSRMVKTVILNRYVDLYRAKKRWRNNRAGYINRLVNECFIEDYEEQDLTFRKRARIAKFLYCLSPDQRFILDSYMEGYKMREIADLLGVTVSHVVTNIRYAKAKLIKIVKGEPVRDYDSIMRSIETKRRNKLGGHN